MSVFFSTTNWKLNQTLSHLQIHQSRIQEFEPQECVNFWLQERGYQHFSRSLRERKALYVQTFSDLVDVPEGSLPETLADEASAILDNDPADRSEGDVVWDACHNIRNGELDSCG